MVFPRVRGRAACAWAVCGLLAALAQGAGAHEVPNDVTIQTYLKAEGQRLRLVVRVPLIAMRDMTWPFRSPDILDLGRAPSELTNAATLWVGDEATVYEGARALPSPRVVAIRATLPTDRSFESYDQALALVTGPPPAETDEITVKEGFLDVLFEYPIESASSRFAIDPRWGRLGIRALTRLSFVLPEGGVRTFELQGDPGLIRLDPAWHQTVVLFTRQGFAHLIDRTDYLFFLLCLILPFRRIREVALVGAMYVVAHSLGLFASVVGLTIEALWFAPLIDTLIAVSIVYVAVENLLGATAERRWRGAFLFGLAHGFGFSLALGKTLQLAGAHALVSRVSFNLGLELALALVVGGLTLALGLLFRFGVPERVGVAITSGLVAHTAWHSMTERGTLLAQYQFTWPDPTPAFLAEVVRWLMAVVTIAGVLWLVTAVTKAGRFTEPSRSSPP